MKILHINSNYLTSKLHENLVDNLDNKGIKNTIYMPIKKEKKEEFLYESRHEIYSPITFKNFHKIFFSYKQKLILDKLNSIIKINNYDLVHAHTLSTDGNAALELKEKFGIPYVVTVRGYTDMRFFKVRFHLRNRGIQILREAEKVIFLSETSQNEMIDSYVPNSEDKELIKNKSVILPNGIDDFWFENSYQHNRFINEKTIKIISVGKVIKLKNLLTTVEALKYIQRNSNFKFILTSVGPIIDKKYAEKVKSAAGEEVRIDFIGNKSREELIQYYRENDVFIMPSFRETFGLVFPEAMSQGLPVLYPKLQGFDNQFPDGHVGYAVDSYDYKDVALKLLKTINNYERLSTTAVKSISKFNWHLISDDYFKIYSSIVK